MAAPASDVSATKGLQGRGQDKAQEDLELAHYVCLSAAWFWATRGLNTLADAGDILTLTRRINGGTNGLVERQALYATALKVLA